MDRESLYKLLKELYYNQKELFREATGFTADDIDVCDIETIIDGFIEADGG